MKRYTSQHKKQSLTANAEPASSSDSKQSESAIGGTIGEISGQIMQKFGNSPDLSLRLFQIGQKASTNVAIMYMKGMVNQPGINEFVAGSLLSDSHGDPDQSTPESWMTFLMNRALSTGEANIVHSVKDMILAILSGDTVILIEDCQDGIVVGTRGGEHRTITEPTSQLVVRGAKDSFVESLSINLSLVRRRIQSPDLWLETIKIGKNSQTDVAMLYVHTIAEQSLVDEVRRRLSSIEINEVLESAYIEEFIQDHTFTPFPTVFNTERPDTAVSNLLEGRVVLIVDGTPFVLIMPVVFAQFFQSAEDYSQRYDIAILMRLVRYLCFIVLLLGPAVYIALTTFHYEMIPTQLLISLMAQREGVPFPAFVEAMLMEIAFEILREAGVRMPRAIGQTVSIVGALILGEAVVQAGIITPVMVIVVSLTGIASFAVPAYNLAIAGRIIRFAFMVLSGLFGFYGITLGLIVLVAHMNSLRSFGIPYMAPFSPFVLSSQKDAVLLFPYWMLNSKGQKKKTSKIQGERNAENKLHVNSSNVSNQTTPGQWGTRKDEDSSASPKPQQQGGTSES
ncbi:spore germination protein KA [Paenibacillus shirakamiensis]|uniref:Spore germination protein KA n=1 Tax=Paenibacillus shirakamiensis TaxID=1265935 RepID=A0ABS4JJK2_9BACL|nr:spore germination protein [Paenibacillus shirakamiensis]MBP2001883.1 spore germination protein KA [Paenibacillus shirakamiensis]